MFPQYYMLENISSISNASELLEDISSILHFSDKINVADS